MQTITKLHIFPLLIWLLLGLASPSLALAASTGNLVAGSNAARIGVGDGNGFESGAGATSLDDSIFATSANTGTGNATDGCTTFNQSEDDAHDFYNFNLSLATGSTIDGINVVTNGKWSTNSGTNQFCIGLSWNGGASWTSAIGTGDIGTSEVTDNMGGATNTWGRTWTPDELSNANFRLRVMIDPGSSNTTTAYLDYLAINVYYTPPPTTTLGDGANPSDATLAPGDNLTDLDSFTLTTDTGTDSVTGATVTLASGAYAGISTLSIASEDGATTYFSPVSPTGDSVSFAGGTPLPITSSPTTFKIRLSPKPHLDMPAPPGSTYSITGTLTDFTSTNTHAGSDPGSATLTVDNTSPGNVTNGQGSSGIEQVYLSWTNPGDADFAQVVVLRRGGSAVTDTPVEGTTYTVGDPIGNSFVACVTASTSCTSTGLAGGTPYHYLIFAKDNRGNYSYLGFVPTGSPYTPIAKVISVVIDSDGFIDYGYIAPGNKRDTTSSGLSDPEVIRNDGNIPEDISIKTSPAVGGVSWSLSPSPGHNTFSHEFSLDGGGSWNFFTTSDVYQPLISNLFVNSQQAIDFRLTVPTSSSDYLQKSLSITVLATEH